eukprot:c21208_g1_i3 orf=423-2321(+)
MRSPQWPHWPLLFILFMPQFHLLATRPLPSQQHSAVDFCDSVEALLAFKHAVGDPPVLSSWVGNPCSRIWKGVHCTGSLQNFAVTSLKLSSLRLDGPLSPALQNLTSLVILWLDSNRLRGHIPPGVGQLRNLISLRLSNNLLSGSIPLSLAELPKLKELLLANNHLSGSLPFDKDKLSDIHILLDGNSQLCTATGSLNLPVCDSGSLTSHKRAFIDTLGSDSHVIAAAESGPALSPAFVLSPVDTSINTSGTGSNIGAIVGGVAGAVVLVAITVALVWFCLVRAKSFPRGHSDTGSSDPSAQLGWAKGPESPLIGGVLTTVAEDQRARQFTLAELEHATKQWNLNNLIGDGRFGLVYKGLLEDGTIVAIKKRISNASDEFVNEVDYLSRVRHRHLVILIGYCQENDQQMLVYDYLPNGSVSSHLYDADGIPLGKLDFKQRLSIALGAAKGLEHIHSMMPPLVHKDFKTSNILVDENFVSKVTDYGLSRLLASPNGAGTAGFLDPEFSALQRLDAKSDVYSFGVFLLELISGREAISTNRPRHEWSLVEWAQLLLEKQDLGVLVDRTLHSNFTEKGIKSVMEVAFQCVEQSADKRPTMDAVVKELDQILEKERGLTGVGEGTAIVTLGSELFT